MKTLTKWILAALVPVAMVGCDPFEEAITGPPAVTGAGFTDTTGPTAYPGTASGSAWTIPGIASTCVGPGQAEVEGFIFVKFNKLLDGGSIQTSPTDCTAVAGMNLVVTPVAPAGGKWYACYNPQSPLPAEGASVIIFLGPAPVPPSTAGPGGWGAASPIPASGNVATNVHATGTVHDKGGAAVSFDVTAQVDPDPGVPGTPTFAGVTVTSVVVNWTAPDCGTVASYDLQRAPDVAGAPGTWATITNTTATTFVDTGLTTATTYWYRVIANTAAGPTTSAAASVTTL